MDKATEEKLVAEFLRKRAAETNEERAIRIAETHSRIMAYPPEPPRNTLANDLIAVAMLLGIPAHRR